MVCSVLGKRCQLPTTTKITNMCEVDVFLNHLKSLTAGTDLLNSYEFLLAKYAPTINNSR